MLNSIVGSLNSSFNPTVELHCKFIELRWTNIGLIGSSTSPRVQRIFVFQFVELLLNSDDSVELLLNSTEFIRIQRNSANWKMVVRGTLLNFRWIRYGFNGVQPGVQRTYNGVNSGVQWGSNYFNPVGSSLEIRWTRYKFNIVQRMFKEPKNEK